MSKKHQNCDICGDYGMAFITTKLEPYSGGQPMRIGCACICLAYQAKALRDAHYLTVDDMRKKYSDMEITPRIGERQAYAEAYADRAANQERVGKVVRWSNKQAREKAPY